MMSGGDAHADLLRGSIIGWATGLFPAMAVCALQLPPLLVLLLIGAACFIQGRWHRTQPRAQNN